MASSIGWCRRGDHAGSTGRGESAYRQSVVSGLWLRVAQVHHVNYRLHASSLAYHQRAKTRLLARSYHSSSICGAKKCRFFCIRGGILVSKRCPSPHIARHNFRFGDLRQRSGFARCAT